MTACSRACLQDLVVLQLDKNIGTFTEPKFTLLPPSPTLLSFQATPNIIPMLCYIFHTCAGSDSFCA